MPKVYTSAVVIIPPLQYWGPIQTIRKEYDRQIHRWMPHINLLYPFRSNLEYDSLEEKFLEACSTIEPREISLNKFRYFNHGHEHFTVWLKPEPMIFLKEVQLKLLRIVPDCNDVNKHEGGFTPHLSLGQVNGRNKLQRLIKSLELNWTALEFTFHEIFFISRENKKNSIFKIERTLSLKNGYEK